jgi:hypothetical protein
MSNDEGLRASLRRDLCENWRNFIGDLAEAGAPSVATA